MGVCLLGPVMVEDGRPLAPRDRAVLCVLAVRRPRVVAPEEIADAVWGERLPATWNTQVHICVGRLRKALGPDGIETVAGGYRLTRAGDELDLDLFEQWTRRGRALATTGEPGRASDAFGKALAIWRGRPFEELDDWEPGRIEAARLGELRRSLEEERVEAQLAAGEHREVVSVAEALVAAEPLRERRWAVLALAQYRCGRQADALRSLARARRMLVEDLGVEPGRELVELEQAILTHDGALDAPVASLPVTDECPYKGLAAYDVGDAEVFFGRDDEVRACTERMRSATMLVVAGPSGCGKSSFVRAGLVAALARAGRPAVVIVPGSDPDDALSSALAQAEPRSVIVIDQFESVFASAIEASTTRAFLRRVAAHSREQGGVVICVRSDHLTGLSLDGEFARSAEQGLHLLAPLTGPALREAIERPATEAGYRLERGLVDLLVRDVDGEPGALPLLSYALVETWRRREGNVLTIDGYEQSGGIRGAVARSADRLYERLSVEQRSMLRGVLVRLVTPSVDGEPVRCRVPTHTFTGDRQREQLVSMLVRARLVTAEAETVELAHEALARAWPRLHAWLDEDAAGLRVLRHLAATAAGWDSLGRPSSELYRGARLDTALEWRASADPHLTGLESEFLEASVTQSENERSELELRARRDERRKRQLSAALIAVAVVAVVSIVVGLIAVDQRRLARSSAAAAVTERLRAEDNAAEAETNAATAASNAAEAEAERRRAESNAAEADAARERADTQRREAQVEVLAGQSALLTGPRTDLAALLAAEAFDLEPNPVTQSALFSVFTRSQGIGPTVPIDDPLDWAVVLPVPGMNQLAEGGPGPTIRLIDTATGHVVRELASGLEGEDSATFSLSSDGRYLVHVVSAEQDPITSLLVWDLTTGTTRFPPVSVPIRTGTVAISTDGSLVAVAGGYDGRTLIYDGTTGAFERELPTLPRPPGARFKGDTVAVAFAPDGRLVVTSQAGPIRFFDARSGRELDRVNGDEQTGEIQIQFDADGGSMATQGFAGTMRYSLPSGDPIWSSPLDILCDALSPPIVQLGILLCTNNGRLLAIDAATGVALGPRFNASPSGWPLLSGDGSTLVVYSGRTITTWRLDGGGLVSRLLPRADHGFATEYSPDGRSLLVNLLTQLPARPADGTLVYHDPAFEVVDAGTGATRARIDGAIVAHFSDAADRIVAQFDDGTIGAFDLVAHRRVGPGIDVGFPVQDFELAGDHAWVWSEFGRDHGQLVSVDLDTGEVTPLREFGDDLLELQTSSSGGLYTLPDGDTELSRIDPRTGDALATADQVGWMTVGDHTIVAARTDAGLVLLDPETLERTGAGFPPLRSAINALVLSDDDRRLLTVDAADGTTRLFDVDSRTQIGGDIAVDISPDAIFLSGALGLEGASGAAIRGDGLQAAITTDAGIVVWELDPTVWRTAACTLANRDLTVDEWDTYVGDLATYHPVCGTT